MADGDEPDRRPDEDKAVREALKYVRSAHSHGSSVVQQFEHQSKKSMEERMAAYRKARGWQ